MASLSDQLFLLAVGSGLWLLILTLVAAGHHTRIKAMEADNVALRRLLQDLKQDLKLEALQTRQELADTIRSEVAYAFSVSRGESHLTVHQTTGDAIRVRDMSNSQGAAFGRDAAASVAPPALP
jgi:hypothetical protein